jgi:hypothetical protein
VVGLQRSELFTRRLPPPWSIDELAACFVVIDSAGQKLAYVYFEDTRRDGLRPTWRSFRSCYVERNPKADIACLACQRRSRLCFSKILHL